MSSAVKTKNANFRVVDIEGFSSIKEAIEELLEQLQKEDSGNVITALFSSDFELEGLGLMFSRNPNFTETKVFVPIQFDPKRQIPFNEIQVEYQNVLE